jgi:hypothetical protein
MYVNTISIPVFRKYLVELYLGKYNTGHVLASRLLVRSMARCGGRATVAAM